MKNDLRKRTRARTAPDCSAAGPQAERIGRLTFGWTFLLFLSVAFCNAETSPPSTANADSDLIATVRQKTMAVSRLSIAATNSTDLAERICAQRVPIEVSTNTNAVVRVQIPDSEPVWNLRGLSLSTGKPLALLNGHWFGVGDRVSSGGMRIGKIGGDRVVLVDQQGVERVVTLYRDRK